MRFDVVTKASPAQVLRAFTDFTERRTRIWNRTLDAKKYRLIEQGDTWAVARESSPGSPFWVTARYDWSDPTEIRWTLVESSYGGAGEGLVRITPGADGGSRLHVTWDNTGGRPLHRALFLLLHSPPMGRMLARMYTAALDRYAGEDPHRT
jgi:hypothetical protein